METGHMLHIVVGQDWPSVSIKILCEICHRPGGSGTPLTFLFKHCTPANVNILSIYLINHRNIS